MPLGQAVVSNYNEWKKKQREKIVLHFLSLFKWEQIDCRCVCMLIQMNEAHILFNVVCFIASFIVHTLTHTQYACRQTHNLCSATLYLTRRQVSFEASYSFHCALCSFRTFALHASAFPSSFIPYNVVDGLMEYFVYWAMDINISYGSISQLNCTVMMKSITVGALMHRFAWCIRIRRKKQRRW